MSSVALLNFIIASFNFTCIQPVGFLRNLLHVYCQTLTPKKKVQIVSRELASENRPLLLNILVQTLCKSCKVMRDCLLLSRLPPSSFGKRQIHYLYTIIPPQKLVGDLQTLKVQNTKVHHTCGSISHLDPLCDCVSAITGAHHCVNQEWISLRHSLGKRHPQSRESLR